MGIQKIMVVGSGLMGSGIAQVCAQAGHEVLLYDLSDEALKKAGIHIILMAHENSIQSD